MKNRDLWHRYFLWAILICLIGFPSAVRSQSIESGWKGIKSLQTTKTEVEKILGNPEVDENGYHNYRAEEAFVQVNYSTEPCSQNRYNRGRYNLPSDTVLEYVVHLKNPLKLADLQFEKEKYYRDTSGDANSIYYQNQKAGVAIGTQPLDETDTEYVTVFRFNVPEAIDEKVKCRSIGTNR